MNNPLSDYNWTFDELIAQIDRLYEELGGLPPIFYDAGVRASHKDPGHKAKSPSVVRRVARLNQNVDVRRAFLFGALLVVDGDPATVRGPSALLQKLAELA